MVKEIEPLRYCLSRPPAMRGYAQVPRRTCAQIAPMQSLVKKLFGKFCAEILQYLRHQIANLVWFENYVIHAGTKARAFVFAIGPS
jgi:thiamine transporter ThiT